MPADSPSLKLAVDGVSPEKKTSYYRERNEKARSAFLQKIQSIPQGNLVYLDESGIELQYQRPYARALRGEKVEVPVSGSASHARISLIAALNNGVLKAPMRFTGHTDTEVFNAWVGQCLVPELEPGQTVLLDNASFHKSTKTRELIESAGCTLLFLPPYSPDLNPIEHCWHTLKSRLRKLQPPLYRFLKSLDSIICNM